MRTLDENLFPLFVCLYNKDGSPNNPVTIQNVTALRYAFRTVIKMALEGKREIRITDSGNLIVFHAKDGNILHDELQVGFDIRDQVRRW